MNLDDIILEVERELIDHAMHKSSGIKQEAAKILGISRHAFLRKLKKLDQHEKIAPCSLLLHKCADTAH